MGKLEERQLRAVLEALTDAEVTSVLNFAQYLRDRRTTAPKPSTEIVEIPRPEDESVIAAIRRLTKTYPMLDRGTVFNEASSLMTRHVVQGESRKDTINRLEALFQSRYTSLQAKSASEGADT
jgi:hypothetical protein